MDTEIKHMKRDLWTNNKEDPNSEYVSAPIDMEYGTTDSTQPESNSKISCPSNPIRVSFKISLPISD